MAGIARRLGVAPRTLQRHLNDEGIGFKDLLDDARKARAKSLVATGELTMAAISRQLGFADTRSFHRAFRRWTSLTPPAYRRNVVRSAPARAIGGKHRS